MLKFGRVIECSQWRLFFLASCNRVIDQLTLGGIASSSMFNWQFVGLTFWASHGFYPQKCLQRGPLSLGNPNTRNASPADRHAGGYSCLTAGARALNLGCQGAMGAFLWWYCWWFKKSGLYQLRLVVYPSYLQSFTTIQTVVWPWDFWTINSTQKTLEKTWRYVIPFSK